MLHFSDGTLLLILPIAFGVLVFMLSFFFPVPNNSTLIESQLLEFAWTLLPMVGLFFLAIPSLSLLYLLDEVGSPSSTSKIIGHQWYWCYESLDSSITTYSVDSYITSSPLRLLHADSPLTVSCGTVLRFLISRADVLHSWTIPAWGLKADAVPGRLNQLVTFLERPGVYYGQCSEICGSNHSFMPILSEVIPLPSRGRL